MSILQVQSCAAALERSPNFRSLTSSELCCSPGGRANSRNLTVCETRRSPGGRANSRNLTFCELCCSPGGRTHFRSPCAAALEHPYNLTASVNYKRP